MNDRFAVTARKSKPGWILLALVAAILVAGWSLLPEPRPAPAEPSATQQQAGAPETAKEPEGQLARSTALQELEEGNALLQVQLDQVNLEAGELRSDLQRCQLNTANGQSAAATRLAQILAELPTKSRRSGPTRASGSVSSIRDAWLQILGEVAVVRGKLYSTANDVRSVELIVEILEDGEVYDSTALELTLNPGETLPWEVELDTPPGGGNLTVRQRIQ